MLVVCQVVYDVVQRIVHHVVEVERREARVEVGGNGRGADLAMPSARAAASCAASPRAGVHRHARVTEGIFCGSRRAFCFSLRFTAFVCVCVCGHKIENMYVIIEREVLGKFACKTG